MIGVIDGRKKEMYLSLIKISNFSLSILKAKPLGIVL